MIKRALQKFCKLQTVNFKRIMASVTEQVQSGEKRAADDVKGVEETDSKKPKTQAAEYKEGRADRKRKCALLIAYNGKGYHGLQINQDVPTIEGEVCKALLDVGLIPEEHYENMHKMSFQRAARTDKGVSAVGNVVSLKMLLNQENLVEKINEKLPGQIRVLDYVRTVGGFNCKNHCDARTYMYILPTFAFAPIEETITSDYRINVDLIEKVNELLDKYKGTHNFHNYTSGIKPTENYAKRYIKEFECRLPYVKDGIEVCVVRITGQSFMYNQIRKMVGMVIAIMRGYTTIKCIQKSFEHEKMDVPKAPALGLVLEKIHYEVYNRKFGHDGFHDKIEWSKCQEQQDKFKEDHITSDIIAQEKADSCMLEWLPGLMQHRLDNPENVWAQQIRPVQDKKLSQASDSEDVTSAASKDQTVSSDNKPSCDVEKTETEDQSISDSKLTNQTQETVEKSDCVTKSDENSEKSSENTEQQSNNDSENLVSAKA